MKYAKTNTGQQALTNRTVVLTQQQRAALIMLDGKRSDTDILTALSGVGVTSADFDVLVGAGLIVVVAEPVKSAPPAAAPAAAPIAANRPAAEPTSHMSPTVNSADSDRYSVAYPIATRLTSSLGLRGYRLTLAVETASTHQDLLKLLPKIQDALGAEKCRDLANALQA